MPKTMQITEYEYHEFEKLVIEAFGLMPDYSVVAAEEWSNDSDHLFDVEGPESFLDFDREELEEIRAAAAAYQEAAAANGGDPQGYGRQPKPQALKDARKRLNEALQYRTTLLLSGLVEQGKIQPGQYNISVCW